MESRPRLKQVHSQVLQEAQKRVQRSYEGFFGRIKAGQTPGHPRFHSAKRHDSFTYTQSGFAFVPLPRTGSHRRNWGIDLSKIGVVKVARHREPAGKVRTLTVKRSRTGKWWVTIVAEFTPLMLPTTGRRTGGDLGLIDFFTLSDGTHYPAPKFYRKGEAAIAKTQRKLEALPAQHPHRKTLLHTLARHHEIIGSRRDNYTHQLSRELVNSYDFIAHEDLDTKRMIVEGWLAKSIHDAAWGEFLHHLTYKAEWAGRQVVTVNPRYTSQRCSGCGRLVPKPLSQRLHSCPHPDCGLVLDRDHNAAINILNLALYQCGSTHCGTSP